MKNSNFIFNHFKEFASFCLLKNFEEVYQHYIVKLKELNDRSLEVLSHLTEQEQEVYFRERLQVFLESAINNCAMAEVEFIVEKWKLGQLPGNIDKYAVQPSDILLGFAARKIALLHYLPEFTNDIHHGLLITKELNIFTLMLEERIFKAYIDIQQEVIHEKNEELNKANIALQNEINERIGTEEKLRREKEFSDAVINNSLDGIFAFDTNLKITSWNKTLEKLNSLSREEVLGKSIFELFPSYKEREEGKAFKEVLLGKISNLGDKPYRHQRGYYEAHIVPLLNSSNEITGGLSIIHDVTQRKITEERIIQRENLLREAQEIAHLGSWEWFVRTNKMVWSDEMYKILGYVPYETEISSGFFYNHLLPEDVGWVKKILDDAFINLSSFSFEARVRRRGGDVHYILVKGKVLAYHNNIPFKMMGIVWDITERKIAEEVLKEKNSELELKNIELKNIELELLKINNELEQRVSERTRQLSEINNDLENEIGERKKIEEALKQRNQELIKINGDLDNFVYTASHDLKAPISNIEGLIMSLNHELLDANGETKIIIDLINQSILKFKDTLNDLTEITKAQRNLEEDIALIDLYKLLDEIKFSIKDIIISSKADIFYDGCEFPHVRFSKANLKSIVYNLLSNAIKYKHPERDPEIHIGCNREGEYLMLFVKDNGLGIRESHKDKVFTMFKRLHDHVEGSGIGLYLVKRIVDNCGGKIELESTEGEGSIFKVYLKVGY